MGNQLIFNKKKMSGSWCTYWQQVGMLYFTQKYKELHIYNRWRMSCIRYWELGINESSTNVIYKYPPSFLTLPGFYQLVCYTVWIEACARQYSPMKQRRQVALASSSILLLCNLRTMLPSLASSISDVDACAIYVDVVPRRKKTCQLFTCFVLNFKLQLTITFTFLFLIFASLGCKQTF